MSDETPKLHLPHFSGAMKQYAEQPSSATYWRWRNGILPDIVEFIVNRPELAEALAKDARDRATQKAEPEAVAA